MTSSEVPYFLAGGGECGRLARSIDWGETALGGIETWPSSLKAIVGAILHSRHPMFLWWGADLIQIYNDGYLPSFGLGKHPAAMGQRGRECWEEAWPIIAPQIEAVMTRGEASWNEDQLVPIWRNGRIEEVYWTYGYSPVYDDAGAIGGTLVVCTETTSRVITERRLVTSRRLLEVLSAARNHSEGIREAVSVLSRANPDLPFVAISEGPDSLMGGLDEQSSALVRALLPSVIEIPGRHTLPSPIVTSSSPQPVTEVYVYPTEPLTKQSIVFGLNPRLTFDKSYQDYVDQLGEICAVAHERSRIENERRNLLEQAPVAAALMIGPDHIFEIANPLYREMVGRDVRGKAYLEAFPELRGTALPEILARVYERGEPFTSPELRVPLDRGGAGHLEECFFRFNLEPIRDAHGKVFGMMAVASEITAQVVARKSLEAVNRAKDEFLATMSHELRTPLNAMLGWAQLLKTEPFDQAKLEKGLDVIERNAMTQARLVSDLLDVSRIISGKLRLSLDQVNLKTAIENAVDVVRSASEAKRIAMTVDLAADIGSITADPDRIQQVIWNLLSNATRFTPEGGTISGARAGSMVRLEVKDSGKGISPDDLPFIFERFRQVDASSTRMHGGLGLGLAIVRYLVEAHGGQVEVQSKGLGHGTSFVVTLPIRSNTHTEPESALNGPSEERPPQREKILLPGVRALIVDDDDDSLDLLSELLRRAEMVVEQAHSGPEALAFTGEFDILISDIGMPQMDGYTLIRRIRSREVGSTVPAIALTAFARREDSERALQAGFQEHIVKPVNASVLLDSIQRLVSVKER